MPQDQKPRQPLKPFEDVHSDSGGEPRRPDFIQNRLNEEWDLPQWERPRRRTSPEEDVPPQERDAALPREPVRRPEKRRSRRPLAVAIILVMIVLTVLAAILLVFKVGEIQVSGSLPEGVTVQQVIDASGIEVGENLVFLSSREAREAIPALIPAIQEVKVHKHLPTTLELEVLPARSGAALLVGGSWLIVSDQSKILSQSGDPEALLKVLCPAPEETAPGAFLTFEDPAVGEILTTVLTTLPQAQEESGLTGSFTLLDLRDTAAMTLYYEDKVLLKLGSALELAYKLKAGCRFLADPTAAETGELDLTSTPETKRGVMTAGTVALPPLPGQTPEPTPSPTPDPDATPNPRDKDIPDTVYTGEPTPAPEEPSSQEPPEDEPTYDEPVYDDEPTYDEPVYDDEPTYDEPSEDDWTPEDGSGESEGEE